MEQAIDGCSSCISRRAVVAGAVIAAATSVAISLEDAAATMPANVDVGATSAVPVKGGRIFTVKGKPVVVTQPRKGVFKAFTGVCTHQGCTVNKVNKNLISCPCHGASFNANSGQPVAGPARGPLKAVPIRIVKGRILL